MSRVDAKYCGVLADTTGHFGPWRRDAPSLTPLDGEYAFRADLGAIKGVAGALDSVGSFGGVLERIEARGSTTPPNFSLPSVHAGALPLETRSTRSSTARAATVFLTTVDARLGASAFTTSGAIGRRGCDAERPPLFGAMRFQVRLDIRPGDVDIVDKLWLTGEFSLEDGRFGSRVVQDKLDEFCCNET